MKVSEEKYTLYTIQRFLHKYFKLKEEHSLVTNGLT